MRYNNKVVEPTGKVLEGIELLLKNHYIVIEILGQIEDTRDIDSLVNFIENGSEEGKKKKKKGKKKKGLTIKENPPKKISPEQSNPTVTTKKEKVYKPLDMDDEKTQREIRLALEAKVKWQNDFLEASGGSCELDLVKYAKERKEKRKKKEDAEKGIPTPQVIQDENFEKLLTTQKELTPELMGFLFTEYIDFAQRVKSLDLVNEDIPALCENNVGEHKLKQEDLDYFLKRKQNIHFIAPRFDSPRFDELKNTFDESTSSVKFDGLKEYMVRLYHVKNHISITPKKGVKFAEKDVTSLRVKMEPCMEVLKIPVGDISHKNETSLLRSFENACWPMASWIQWITNIYQV